MQNAISTKYVSLVFCQTLFSRTHKGKSARFCLSFHPSAHIRKPAGLTRDRPPPLGALPAT